MRTQLIIFNRPNNGIVASGPIQTGTASTGWTQKSGVAYTSGLNPNEPVDQDYLLDRAMSGQGLNVDLYDDIDMPITYTILDVREPDKRKTAWSKTIKIPGTKNNNRLFKHIYHISGDGWIKIGNSLVYTNFNPNIRKEVIIQTDGIQVMKGNMQLKTIKKDADGNVEYDIIVSGDLSSLFFDVGEAKLNDLDFSEWDHDWSKTNIINSWTGTVMRNGLPTSNITQGTAKTLSRIYKNQATGRLAFKTTSSHGFQEGDFIRSQAGPIGIINLVSTTINVANGVWCVTDVISSTEFEVNCPYPLQLMSSSTYNSTTGIDATPNGTVYKVSSTGQGYVYPLISWGDEYDYNSFPVTSMAPAYYIKEIWDKIFAETNSKYQSSFLNSEFFKRLIVTQKKTSYDLTQAQINERKFFVGSTLEHTTMASAVKRSWAYLNTTSVGATTSGASDAYLQSAVNGQTTIQKFPFYVEVGYHTATSSFGDPGNAFANNTWTVQKSGEYQIGCLMKMDSWIDIDGYGGAAPGTGTASLPTPTNPSSSYFPKHHYYPGHKGVGSNYSTLSGGPISSEVYHPYIRAQVVMVRERLSQVTETVIATQDFISNGYAYWTNNAHWPYFGRYRPAGWLDKVLTGSYNGYFSKDEKVYITVKYYLHAHSNTNATYGSNTCAAIYEYESLESGEYYYNELKCRWYLRTRGVQTFGNEPSPKSTENSIIYGREFLPKDMTCRDFLKNIIKMFNLHIEPDRQIERLYYIEPRDDYYYDGSGGATDYEDWTDKLDADSVEITPMGELISKYYTFKNKAETDYWNKRFKDERGRDYTSYTKEVINDFLKNTTTIDVSFGSTVMINNPERSDVVMPCVLQKESNGSVKPVSNSAARVLIWVGLRPYSIERGQGILQANNTLYPGYEGWELISSTNIVEINATASFNKLYPYAGTVDSPQDPAYDINWFNMEENDFVYWDYARWSDNNLYMKYWNNFIQEVSDPASMVVRGNFDLSPTDIFNLDFRKIYVVDNVYYRLQKVIDFNPVKKGLTKVELLKLKRPTRFTPRSLFPHGVFESYTDYTRPITTTWDIRPPRVKKFRDGSYVNAVPGSMGLGTINVTGLSNQIGNVRNVTVNGNENQVGDGAYNINITSGSSVQIAAGVSNVNVVGTSKVIINENDVTYINGIRYKNGVPISRCNVIDAGITSATSSLVSGINRNTTINVIDGGEDVISFSGAATYENVINAGQDSILPDVPELGIATKSTPNPRTNYSGGADYSSPTASMVEIVRQTRQAL